MLLFVLACTQTTELNPLMVPIPGMSLDRVIVSLRQLDLESCQGRMEHISGGRRFDLKQPQPIVIHDRKWCTLNVQIWRDWTLSGQTDAGARFLYLLPATDLKIDQEFYGNGEELGLLFDASALLDATAIDALAFQSVLLRPEISLGPDSPEVQEMVLKLPHAFQVAPLSTLRQQYGAAWPYVDADFSWPTSPPVETAIRERDSDTQADSAGYGWESASQAWPTEGCSCSGETRESAFIESQASTQDSSAPESAQDSTEHQGCWCGGSDDSGDSSAQSRHLGAFAMALFWFSRRRVSIHA